MSAFSTPRVDPRIARLQIKEGEWALVRRTQMSALAAYLQLRWNREAWTISEGGTILMNRHVAEESPIFRRTVHYHNVRRSINKVRAAALTSMTR